MTDSTNPRVMADNIKELFETSGSQAADISTLETTVGNQGDAIGTLQTTVGNQGDAIGTLQTTVGTHGTAIGALQTYDDAETDTGKKWIDGRPIYRKVVFIETMPNNASLGTPHGITDLDFMTSLTGVAIGSVSRPIPYSNSVLLSYNATNISLLTSIDMSAYSAYVTCEYVKLAPEAEP